MGKKYYFGDIDLIFSDSICLHVNGKGHDGKHGAETLLLPVFCKCRFLYFFVPKHILTATAT